MKDVPESKLVGKVASEVLVGGKMPPRWERAARKLAAGEKPKQVRLDCFMNPDEWLSMRKHVPWQDYYLLSIRTEENLHYEVRRKLLERAIDAPEIIAKEMNRVETDEHYNANRSLRAAESLLIHSGTSAPKQIKTSITHKYQFTPEQSEAIEITWEEIKDTVSLDDQRDVEPKPNQKFSI